MNFARIPLSLIKIEISLYILLTCYQSTRCKKNMNQRQTEICFSKDKELATLGGGCFWCMEAIFSELKGVEKVESGYSGGILQNPTYEEICTGKTGHAEVVQITFDPKVISFKEILHIFFKVHDPTTLNRQGPDIGPQYRSIILYRDEKQRAIAEEVIEGINAAKIHSQPIVTQIKPFKIFFKAEDYHQEFYKKNPHHRYCELIIGPKLAEIHENYRKK